MEEETAAAIHWRFFSPTLDMCVGLSTETRNIWQHLFCVWLFNAKQGSLFGEIASTGRGLIIRQDV